MTSLELVGITKRVWNYLKVVWCTVSDGREYQIISFYVYTAKHIPKAVNDNCMLPDKVYYVNITTQEYRSNSLTCLS